MSAPLHAHRKVPEAPQPVTGTRQIPLGEPDRGVPGRAEGGLERPAVPVRHVQPVPGQVRGGATLHAPLAGLQLRRGDQGAEAVGQRGGGGQQRSGEGGDEETLGGSRGESGSRLLQSN